MTNLTDLSCLSLREKELLVYTSLLDLGRATVIDLSQKTRMKRMTVYDIVMNLVKMGFAAEAKKGKRRVFIAEDPSTLINKYEQKLIEVKEIVPFLNNLYRKSIPKPKIKFYDGINGIKNIMEEMLTLKNTTQRWWSSFNDLIELLGKVYMEQWVRRRVRRGIRTKVLLTENSTLGSCFEPKEIYLREAHFLPKSFSFNGVVSIFDNKVAFIASDKESFGFVIESNEFSKMMRAVFDNVWMITPNKNA